MIQMQRQSVRDSRQIAQDLDKYCLKITVHILRTVVSIQLPQYLTSIAAFHTQVLMITEYCHTAKLGA